MSSNPRVMLGITRVGGEMETQLVEGRAEVLDGPAATAACCRADRSQYDDLLAAEGLTWPAFIARCSTVIRVVPSRFLPWQGSAPARAAAPAAPAARFGAAPASASAFDARAVSAVPA